MKNLRQESGQVVVLGLIIALLIFITVISLVNFVQVPIEEQHNEEQHISDVDDEFVNIQSSIISSGFGQRTKTTSLNRGPNYDQGFILGSPFPKITNFPPRGEISFENVNDKYKLSGDPIQIASEGLECNTTGCGDNILGSTYNLDGGLLEYTISYNQMDDIRKVTDGISHYEDINGNYVYRSNQRIMNRNNIRLIGLKGDEFSREGRNNIDLTTTPVSSSETSLPVTNLEDIHIKSELPLEEWERNLNPQSNQYIQGLSPSNEAGYEIQVQLYPDESYNLDIGKVGVHTVGTSIDESKSLNYAIINPSEYHVEQDQYIQLEAVILDEYYNKPRGGYVDFEQTSDQTDGEWITGPDNVKTQEGQSIGIWKSEEEGRAEFEISDFGQ